MKLNIQKFKKSYLVKGAILSTLLVFMTNCTSFRSQKTNIAFEENKEVYSRKNKLERTDYFKVTDAETRWVDSIYNNMSLDEKIGQLFMVSAYSNKGSLHKNEVEKLGMDGCNSIDTFKAIQSISKAYNLAVKNINEKIDETVIIIGQDYVKMPVVDVEINMENKIITKNDITKILQDMVINHEYYNDYIAIQVQSAWFVLDNGISVLDPVNHKTSILRCYALLYFVDKNIYSNFQEIFSKCGIINPRFKAMFFERKHKYVSGTLSFRDGEKPTDAQLQKIVDAFRKTFMAGLEPGVNYVDYWNIHEDKGNIELNYVIPLVELTTSRQMNPFPPGKAKEDFKDAFDAYINHQMGYNQVVPDPIKASQSQFEVKVLPKSSSKIAEIGRAHV